MNTPAPDDDPDAERPRDLRAERAVLGAMMLDSEVIGQVTALLGAGDFYRPVHTEIFTRICDQFERGRPTDPVAIAAAFTGPELLRIGGAPYLHTLISESPTAVNGAYYAEIVADRAVRARLLDAGSRIRQLATHGGMDETTAVLERAQDAVEAAAGVRGPDSEDGAWVAGAIDEEVAAWEEPDAPGLLTGYTDLDAVVGGLRGGQLIIVAGRPGIGKSVVATDWGRHIAEAGGAVLDFSLEMSRREVMQRLVAAKAKVRLRDIRQRTWTPHERGLMTAAARALREVTFRIEDGADVTLSAVRSKARAMARSATGLDLVIVDYLQLMAGGGRAESRQQEVSEFSRGLKVLAKELDVPVVALSQLNRGPEQRTDHRPMLSDLRESGSLEQDADLVVLLNRPDAWERDDPRAGEADLILAKHRNGPTTTITVAHQLHYARFADLARGVAEAA